MFSFLVLPVIIIINAQKKYIFLSAKTKLSIVGPYTCGLGINRLRGAVGHNANRPRVTKLQ